MRFLGACKPDFTVKPLKSVNIFDTCTFAGFIFAHNYFAMLALN